MHNECEIIFRFSCFSLVLCHLNDDACSQNHGRAMEAQHGREIPQNPAFLASNSFPFVLFFALTFSIWMLGKVSNVF